MAILSSNKNTKHLLRSDINFLLHLIADLNIVKTFPLTKRGRLILKLLWGENKSFCQVAEELSLSQARVTQIYHLEVRRLSYFIDATFKEVTDLKKEHDLLKKQNKLLLEENEKLKKTETTHHLRTDSI